MASITSTLTHNDSPLLVAVQGLAVGSTLFVAGSMATISIQALPALVLASKQKDRRPSSSRGMESGRLTPQPSSGNEKQLSLTPVSTMQGNLGEQALSASSGYKIAAMQFSLMSKTAFATQVPAELLAIIASGYMAYHYRAAALPASIWGKWAAVAGLIAAVFPLTGGFMVPIDHKIARIAGEEAQVEPYEDAPPDREMERSNTEGFLKQWGALNTIRTGLMAAAGGVGLWSLLE